METEKNMKQKITLLSNSVVYKKYSMNLRLVTGLSIQSALVCNRLYCI
jgi:hypothetical protein